jgi:hypothetical protein
MTMVTTRAGVRVRMRVSVRVGIRDMTKIILKVSDVNIGYVGLGGKEEAP